MNGWQQISDADHHSGSYLTSTGLKAALKSPAHFRHHMDGKTADSPAFAFGRAVHGRVLEPWDYQKKFAIAPKVDRRTKDGKAEWAEFCKRSHDKEIVSKDDGAAIEDIAQSIANNPDSSRWLNPDTDDSFVEQSGIVEDDPRGLPWAFACRPDLRVVGDYIVDLKTCKDASPGHVEKSLVNFGYALSAAWYCDLATRIDGGMYRFVWVFVEKTAPYAVACYEADAEVLAYGREKYEQALDVISEAVKTNQFPASYHRGTMTISLPRWAK